MKKYKIYISKSKQSDFNQLLKLKSDLFKFKNIEVLEFQGGTYNTDLLLSADLVIFIPPKNSELISHNDTWCEIEVGKGQYEEFLNAHLRNFKSIPCELYYNNEFHTIDNCDEYSEGDQNWQEWGLLYTEETSSTNDLQEVLESNFDNNFNSLNNTVKLSNNINLKKLLIN